MNARPGPVKRNADDKDLTTSAFTDALFLKYHMVERYSPVIDQVVDIYKRFDEARASVPTA